ncbi:MAG: hypothetical protein D6786_10630 [Gammaproteobacteria bacterium]|nr:MAG: hypothetical protein D6786_10630 [Gammaproteobacteria bacterium]
MLADGSADPLSNIPVTLAGGTLQVAPVNAGSLGRIQVLAPQGVFLSTGSLRTATRVRDLDITNDSGFNLLLDAIDLNFSQGSIAGLRFEDINGPQAGPPIHPVDAGSRASILNHGAGDVLFRAGLSGAPDTVLQVTNDRGGILDDPSGSGAPLVAHSILLEAPHGSIGNPVRPLPLQLMRLLGAPEATLAASSLRGIHIDVEGPQFSGALPAGTTLDRLRLSGLGSLGDISVHAGPRQAPTATQGADLLFDIDDILSGGRVTLDGRPGTGWRLNGTLTSGLEQFDFAIDAAGKATVTPFFDLWQNPDTFLSDGVIRLETLFLPGGGVAIDGDRLDGAGTIRVLQGGTRARIRNDFPLPLTLDGVAIAPGGGAVRFNADNEVTSGEYGAIQVVRGGPAEGLLEVDTVGDLAATRSLDYLAGKVRLTSTGGSIRVRDLSSHAGVALSAAGSITDLAPANAIHLDLGGARVDATADGDIRLQGLNELRVGRVAADGDVELGALFDLLGADPAGGVNVKGFNVRLQTIAGSIGKAGDRLVIDSGGDLTAGPGNSGRTDLLAQTGIHLEERFGDLDLARAETVSGPLDIFVPNGTTRLPRIATGGPLRMVFNGGGLVLDQVDTDSLDLTVTGEGGTLTIGQARIGTNMTLRADNIHLGGVTHTGSGPLRLDLSGNDGGTGDSLFLRVLSGGGVSLHSLHMRLAQILSGPYRLLVGGTDGGGYDAWVIGRNGQAINLDLGDTPRLLTDALTLRNRPEFLVNRFGTENTAERLAGKLNTLDSQQLDALRLRLRQALARLGLLNAGDLIDTSGFYPVTGP